MQIDAKMFEHVGSNVASSQAVVRPSLSFWQDAWRRFKKNKIAIVCLVFLVVMILGSIVVIIPNLTSLKYNLGILTRFNYSDQDLISTYAKNGVEGHLLGTDELGRDLFTRLWLGLGISVFIGVAAALLDFFIGFIYGGISGFFGGAIDNVMMRIVEIINGIPYLIIVILLMVVLKPGLFTIILAYALVGWTGMARLVRGQVLQLKEQEFVLAAQVLGAGSFRIIFRHLLPNIMGLIVVSMTMTIPSAIFTEAFLSFIGLGVPIPMASLGTLASDGVAAIHVRPALLLFPAVLISSTMLAFNLLGDALRDILDPKMRK